MIFNTVISGGGSIVEAKAIGSTVNFTEGDKVLLTPTTDMFDSTMYSYKYDLAGTSTSNYTMSGHEGGSCGSQLCYSYTKNHAIVSGRTTWDKDTASISWSSDKETVTGSHQNDYTGLMYTCYNNPNFQPASMIDGVSYGTLYGRNIGVVSSGAYTPLYNTFNNANCLGITSIDRFVKCYTGTGNAYKDLIRINEDMTVSYYNVGDARNFMASKYNGVWYIVGNNVYDLSSTQVFTISGRTGNGVYYFFDDNGDYFLEFNSYLRFKKITKGPSAWTESELTSCSEAINSCLRDPTTTPSWSAKDFGDRVEMFIVGDLFGYYANGVGNKVAHLIFDKTTETFTRLPDVFMEIPDGYTRAGHLQVNWKEGLISVEVSYRISNSDGDHFGIFIKKFNDLANIYKYNAYKNSKGYYYKDTITGFVKENKGVNELGDNVLSVETTEDPNGAPWAGEGVVFGMGVTVKEGDPT